MSENRVLEQLKRPLTMNDLDLVLERHCAAICAMAGFLSDLNSNTRVIDVTDRVGHIFALLGESIDDIPRLVIEVRRAQMEAEKKKPAEAGSVLRDYPIG